MALSLGEGRGSFAAEALDAWTRSNASSVLRGHEVNQVTLRPGLKDSDRAIAGVLCPRQRAIAERVRRAGARPKIHVAAGLSSRASLGRGCPHIFGRDGFPMTMQKPMTLQEAKSIARHLGLTLRKVRSGDYRVNFRDGDETTAHYTDNLEDAVNAAVEMARKRELRAPHRAE